MTPTTYLTATLHLGEFMSDFVIDIDDHSMLICLVAYTTLN